MRNPVSSNEFYENLNNGYLTLLGNFCTGDNLGEEKTDVYRHTKTQRIWLSSVMEDIRIGTVFRTYVVDKEDEKLYLKLIKK